MATQTKRTTKPADDAAPGKPTKKDQILALAASGLGDVADIALMTQSRPSYVGTVLQDAGKDLGYFDLYTSTNRPMNVYSKFFAGHLGFKDVWVGMAQPIESLDARLAEAEATGEWRATTHVQSDDELSVERAVGQFLPRLQAPVIQSGESWMRITDPVLDHDRDAHGRLAKEVSERLGAVTVALALEGPVVRFRLYERGRMVDEYLSVPTYYGPLPKGDELALAANPTLVSRLTGADRDDVTRVARNAATPAELPPASELYEQIARLMGLEP